MPYRTKPYLDTPLNNRPDSDPEEVEVIDPTHPLFGRRFPVLSISRQPQSPPTVFVAYRDTMRLRIPVSSTSLGSNTKSGKFAALLFHGLCRLGKIDRASESHQELDRCLSRTITPSKNFND